ncbi:sugar ABC transporter permease [Kitasatospora xanthocidica]|uniref:Sugar ABC transporter permease n=1 Tax=Kitasatospora xanthocidica TaxID=83382 RepID=A0A373A126_9ACTN|nr:MULTISPECIES: sugar ABC transporter permease [Streptomycetaceae]OKI10601.1 sugar ABC transporter permease [Streptomyces sp. CB02056]RGD61320.1 sugar ABC transporter permease [Kitasatospora xanthocidica]
MAVHSERVQTQSPDPGKAAVAGQETSASGGGSKGTAPKGARSAGGPSLGSRLAPYLLLLPATVATLALLGWPLLKTVLLSFQNLNRRQLVLHLTEWTGFDNYKEQLTDPEFWSVTGRTIVFTLVNVVLIMVGGTLIGLLLNQLGKKMRLVLQVALLLAWAMPVVAATTVYTWLFDSQWGVVNWILEQLGWQSMHGYNWLSNQYSTFFVIILLIVWMSIPFVAFNMYAGLTTIPKELYEAARMDGAGARKIFTAVIFPNLKPFFLATTFLEVIWVFKAFTQVYAVNAGGPEKLTRTLPVHAFLEGSAGQHYGVGSAIAVLTILMLGVLMAYYFRIMIKQEDEL